jgi:hypothetical protein
MVVGLLLLGSLAVNALLAVVAFARFVYYDGPSTDRPDSMLLAASILVVAAAELVVFGYAILESLRTGTPGVSNVAVLILNSLLILLFIAYIERSSLRSTTARLRPTRSGS